MLYTFQRRKALNKAVREMYPEVKFYESANGVPMLECYELPKQMKQVQDLEWFIHEVRMHCSKKIGLGNLEPDYSKALPVFILSLELTGEGSKQENYFYRVNYVSITEPSLRKAEQYIAEGKLYAALPTKESNP
jgi:hypothetical protein